MADIAILSSAGRPDMTYLNTLREQSSRTTMEVCIKNIARLYPKRPIWTWQFEDAAEAFRLINENFANPYTVNKHLACIRGVMRAAVEMGLMDPGTFQSASKAIKTVKGSRLPAGRMLAQDEIDAMIRHCDIQTPLGARDAAMLAILRAGPRMDEVVGLDLADWQPPSIRVMGKGDKERLVPLPLRGLVYMEKWLYWRGNGHGPLLTRVNAMWPNGTVIFTPITRLTSEAVRCRLSRLCKDCGLAHFSAHDFRRTIASELLSRVDPKTVRDLLGHVNLDTTMRYDRRSDERIEQAMASVMLGDEEEAK